MQGALNGTFDCIQATGDLDLHVARYIEHQCQELADTTAYQQLVWCLPFAHKFEATTHGVLGHCI
jgi:hypothetical protein